MTQGQKTSTSLGTQQARKSFYFYFLFSLVKVGAYIGYFASEIITENIRKLARRVGSRKRRTFLMGTKPITDTERFLAGGAIGYLSAENFGLGCLWTMVVTRRSAAECI